MSAKVLATLVIAEFGIILLLVAAIAIRGLPAPLDFSPLSFEGVPPGGLGIIFVFAFGAYSGFEATTLYSAEAKDTRRTIPIATYLAVLIIGAFFAVSGIFVVEAAGPGSLVAAVQQNADPVEFIFNIARTYAGEWIVLPMWILFTTSLFACILSFQNNVARYFYFLSKEGFLTTWFGEAHPVYKSPHRAAVVQTVMSLITISIFALEGLDPLLTLFAWLGNLSVLCLMVLMTVVSISVITFFRRNPSLEPGQALKTMIMPALAAAGLAATVFYGVTGFHILIGSEGPLSFILPALIPIAGVIGAITARMRPDAMTKLHLA